MQRFVRRMATCVTLLCGVMLTLMLDAHASDGPLGLHWGMPNEAVEQLGVGLCCRQVGKWGARYQVNSQDFGNLPNPLGDEEKVYVYFGNTNKLLRVYIAIKKIDGKNRYKQINVIVNQQYNLVKSCVRRTYTRYEALRAGKTEETCRDYEGFSEYTKDNIEVFVGLEQHSRDYTISLILLNRGLHEKDKGKKSPL